MVSEQEISGKSVNEYMELVNKKLYERWQTRDQCMRGRVTYGFIRDVSFVERCEDFDPNLYVGYVLTGHESMNGFLYERGLSDTERCACGAECENWKHVLIDCPLYDDI